MTALQAASDDLPAHRDDDEVRLAIAGLGQALEALREGEAMPAVKAAAGRDDDADVDTLDDDWDEEDPDADE